MDEACAMIRTEIDSMPSELDDLRRDIMQLEIEEMSLKKEEDKLSQDRLAKPVSYTHLGLNITSRVISIAMI